MGSCSCKGTFVIPNNDQLKVQIRQAIEENRYKVLDHIQTAYLLSAENALSIEDPLLSIQGVLHKQVQINALAYATRLGNVKMFRYLHEQCGASLKGVRAVYAQVLKTPMDIVCEHGFYDLLKYYLPLYLQDTEPLDSLNSHDLSFLSKDLTPPPTSIATSTQLAVHRACEKAHMDIVRYLHEYFANTKPPLEFDLHTEDEGNGENTALIACRTGSMKVIRYLFYEVGVNFHKLNKRKESAVQIAAAASKRSETSHYEVIRFLVEEAHIDITYNHEETLIIASDARIVAYLESQILRAGCMTQDKRQLDEQYSLSQNRYLERQEVTALNTGSRFNIGEIFKQELFSESYLSSISQKSPDMSLG
jgi:hypothetical protein